MRKLPARWASAEKRSRDGSNSSAWTCRGGSGDSGTRGSGLGLVNRGWFGMKRQRPMDGGWKDGRRFCFFCFFSC